MKNNFQLGDYVKFKINNFTIGKIINLDCGPTIGSKLIIIESHNGSRYILTEESMSSLTREEIMIHLLEN